MNKFLEKCNLLTLTQEDTENLQCPTNSKEYTSVAQTLRQYWFLNKFYQTPKEEVITKLVNLRIKQDHSQIIL